MAEPITIQKLIDADVDVDTLGEAVNEDKMITSRLGREYASVPMASRLLVENGLLGATPFSTYASMTASNLADESYAVVTNNTDITKNGFYQKISSAWAFLNWNPLAQSKDYVNSRLDPLNQITINSGKDYPLRKMTRDSVTSVANSYLNDALLDVSIVGARPDKIYRIGYLKNGYVGLGDYAYGIAVYEYDKDYTNELRIIDYTNPAPDLAMGGVQSQTVSSAIYTDFSIKLTFDTDKLPPAGTNINLMRDTDAAYSWIIDPSTYQLKLPKNGVYYSINSTDDISFTYQSDGYIYRVTFGKNGYNNLPNVKKIERATTTKPHVWVVISETDTDYLPPMVVRAVNDGDSVTSLYYTGGNHGASGSAGGAQTARNMLYKIKIDGQDAAYQKSGYATSITLHIVNELMAYNTITLSRYVIRQSFNVTLKAGQIIVNSDVKALEPVEITTENGLQLYTGGYQGTMLMLGGKTVDRVAFSTDVSSGKKYLQPNAFATVLINGFDQIAMWMDRAYEAGDGRYVGTSTALIRSGNGTNTKFYNAIVSNSPTTLEKGEGYKWRGGYAIEHKEAPTGYDSWFSKDNGFVVAVDASNYSIVD